MNRNFIPGNGRGRGAYGAPQPPYGAPSPLPNYRQPSNPSRGGPNMGPQFQNSMPPGSPYGRGGGRNSPAVNPSQPNMAPSHMGGPPMQYGGYPQHMAPPQHQVNTPFLSPNASKPQSFQASALRHVSSSEGSDGRLQRQVGVSKATNLNVSAIDGHEEPILTNGNSQQQSMYPQFDPQSGYYQPYWYGGGPPPSPRPPYPSPYNAPQGAMPGQPPFHPPNMSRSTSTAGSERPSSSMGHPQTPSMPQAAQPSHPPSQTPSNFQPPPAAASANFVKPKKTSSAIKITDAQGNEVSFNKPSPTPAASAQPQTPLIVSTPSAPTPPPRAPSNQHVRTESKAAPTQTAEEKVKAFQEQVKRQVEEEKRQKEEAEAAKAKPEAAADETSWRDDTDLETEEWDVVEAGDVVVFGLC